MLTDTDIRIFKALQKDATRKRNIARAKNLNPKADILFLNGMRVEYAFYRLYAINNILKLFAKNLTRSNAKSTLSKITKAGCLHDYSILSKLSPLLPEDSKLRDDYVVIVRTATKKLAAIAKTSKREYTNV